MRLLLLFLTFSCLTGCGPKPQASDTRASEVEQTTDTTPQGHDYLSVSVRAKDHAEDQLNDVQKERRQQSAEEKSFDRPATPTP